MMTDHPEPEPTPTTSTTPVAAVPGWSDVFRPEELVPDELVLLAEFADPRGRRTVLPDADRDRLAVLIVSGYLTTPGQGLDLTDWGLAALDAVHVDAHGDYLGYDPDGVWHRPHPDPTPATSWGWDR